MDSDGHAALVAVLEQGGFVAAEEEATELLSCADGDSVLLDELVARRLTGEPLAWIVGSAPFCGLRVIVHPGVYVPRWQSEVLAVQALERLPASGVAVELCTGAGAIARLLMARRPEARVVAGDIDPGAVACARANDVDAYEGDLFDPLPRDVAGRADVVVGVLPYVPTPELGLLQRDTFTFETPLAYDGGSDGLDLLRRAIAESPRVLRPGGALLLELGGDQAGALADDLAAAGFGQATILRDEYGDVRGVEALLRG